MKQAEERPRKRRRPLGVRLLRVAIEALVALALLYLVGINVFLSTPLFAKVIDADPDTIDIHYRRGWSVVPGHIHAKDLSIRGRDRHVEWILRLDEADFDMSFAALAKARFDVSRVHGTGISFRVRRRLDAPPTTPEQVADLPPIEGFAAYSVRPRTAPSADLWSDLDYHLWTAHLEELVADDVREVWIDRVRFEGSARIAGRFYFKPLRAVDVGPVHIEVRQGSVREGASILVDGLGGSRADVTVAQFDPRTADAADLLHHVSVALDAHGVCPETANFPVAPPRGIELEGPVEVSRLVLEVKKGVVTGEGFLDAKAPRAVVTTGEHRLTGALALTGNVTRNEGRDGLEFRVDMTGLAVARAKGTHAADGVFLRAERAVVSGDSHALDLARPLDDLHIVVELPEGVLAHAHDLSAYIPKKTPLVLLGGSGRAEGRLEVWFADKRATGRGSLHAEDLDLRLAKMRVRGATSARASFAAWSWETHRLQDARLAADISHGSLAAERTPNTPFVRVNGLHVDARGMDADLDDPLRDLEVGITIPEGRVTDRKLLQAYLPKGSAMDVAFGRFSAAFHLVLADHLAKGTLAVQSKRLRLTYADLELAADVRAHARVHAWAWERGDLSLDDAAVDVRDISVSRRDRAGSGEPAVSVGRISLHAKSSRFAFADPLARVELDASILDGKVNDSSAINAFLPAESTFAIVADGGKLSVEIHAGITRHVARGTIAVSTENVGIAGKSIRLQGDTEVTAEVSDWDFDNDTMTVLDGRAIVTRASGSLHPRGAWEFGADRIELSGRAQSLDLVRPRLFGIDGRLVVTNAVLPDARSLQVLLPADGILTIESGRVHVSADAELSASKRTATAIVDVVLAHAGVRFHEVHLLGDFHVVARVQSFDPDQGVVDLSGSTLEMRNVYVTNASTEASRWGGDAVMRNATLRLATSELDTSLTLDAYDASPILAVILQNDLPSIVAGMTSMPRLRASTRLTVGTHQFAFRDVDARGGNLALRGCYVVRGEHRHGAFIIDKGILSVGLRLADTGSVVIRFFGLDGWLRDETDQALRLWNVAP